MWRDALAIFIVASKSSSATIQYSQQPYITGLGRQGSYGNHVPLSHTAPHLNDHFKFIA